MYLEENPMTIKKKLIILGFSLVLISTLLSSIISGLYIDRYFTNYIKEEHLNNIENIKIFAQEILLENPNEVEIYSRELANYIKEPIFGIKIRNKNNEDIISVGPRGMQNHMMGMRHNMALQDDSYEIYSNGNHLGYIIITTTSNLQDTQSITLFKNSLVRSTAISFFIVLLFSFFIIGYMSEKMSKELIKTSRYARNIEEDNNEEIQMSSVVEIKGIQTSLFNLSKRLRMKESIRKEKADKLYHEIRTPLSILKANIEGAYDDIIELDKDRLLNLIKQTDIITSMVKNISSIMEYNEEVEKIEFNDFDIAKEIESIIRGLEAQFNQKGIRLSLISPKSLIINSNKDKLNQAIYNLLTNAYKFTDENEEVEAELYIEENKVVIEIKDTGIGINEHEINEIFKPYFRGKNVKNYKGEGLGLHIAKQNITNLGGEIEASKNKDKGSVFRIILKL